MTVNEIREWLQLRLTGSQDVVERFEAYAKASTDRSALEIGTDRGYAQAVLEETWFLERLLVAIDKDTE